MENATREALDRIHSEMVPYLNDDTESKATYCEVGMLRKIMIGDFEVVDNHIEVDGWVNRMGGIGNERTKKTKD